MVLQRDPRAGDLIEHLVDRVAHPEPPEVISFEKFALRHPSKPNTWSPPGMSTRTRTTPEGAEITLIQIKFGAAYFTAAIPC